MKAINYSLEDFEKLKKALEKAAPSPSKPIPAIPQGIKAMSVREALFSPSKTVTLNEAIGKICANPSVSCPPAIPIAVSGEIITEAIAKIFKYYNKTTVDIITKPQA